MKKVLITGSNGFLAQNLKSEILFRYPNCEIIKLNRSEFDLANIDDMIDFGKSNSQKIDYFFHCAVDVEPNNYKNLQYIYTANQLINTNALILWTRFFPTAKFITFGTSASYDTSRCKESNYLKDEINNNNYTYVTTKRALLCGLQAISSDDKYFKWLYYVPSTFFGVNPNKDDHHLLSDLIRNINEAKKHNLKSLEINVNKNSLKNLISIKDAAKIILDTIDLESNEIINLCSNVNMPFYKIVDSIKKILNVENLDIIYNGEAQLKRMEINSLYENYVFDSLLDSSYFVETINNLTN